MLVLSVQHVCPTVTHIIKSSPPLQTYSSHDDYLSLLTVLVCQLKQMTKVKYVDYIVESLSFPENLSVLH